MHFLSINLISFHWSCGIVLVMAAPAQEMDSASRVKCRERYTKY